MRFMIGPQRAAVRSSLAAHNSSCAVPTKAGTDNHKSLQFSRETSGYGSAACAAGGAIVSEIMRSLLRRNRRWLAGVGVFVFAGAVGLLVARLMTAAGDAADRARCRIDSRADECSGGADDIGRRADNGAA